MKKIIKATCCAESETKKLAFEHISVMMLPIKGAAYVIKAGLSTALEGFGHIAAGISGAKNQPNTVS